MVDNGAPLIFDNLIVGNSAPNQDGGGLAIINTASFGRARQLQVVRNVFGGNSCNDSGGAVFGIESESNSPTYYAHNLLVGNSAKVGGGMALRNNALLVNNTITDNQASERAGAILRGGGSGIIEIVTDPLEQRRADPTGDRRRRRWRGADLARRLLGRRRRLRR